MNTITIKDQKLGYLGDASMLLCPLTAYLCSHRVPDGVGSVVGQWVNSVDVANTCVICGNLSGNERYPLRLLVKRGIPVVLALATAIPADIALLKLDPFLLDAFYTGRVVIISPILDETITEATGKTAGARNDMMIALADQIVVGFMSENGNLYRRLFFRNNVHVLCTEGQEQVRETDSSKIESQSTRMGWDIYRLLKEEKNTPLTSVELRQLLAQYLKLPGLQKPSLLHSLILSQVMIHFRKLPDFNFTAFIRMWNLNNLRPEDYKGQREGKVWYPSLAERVLSRLFKALPGKFNEAINPNEVFDAQLAHFLLDKVSQHTSRKNVKVLNMALRLAYYDHDKEAVARYRAMIDELKHP